MRWPRNGATQSVIFPLRLKCKWRYHRKIEKCLASQLFHSWSKGNGFKSLRSGESEQRRRRKSDEARENRKKYLSLTLPSTFGFCSLPFLRIGAPRRSDCPKFQKRPSSSVCLCFVRDNNFCRNASRCCLRNVEDGNCGCRLVTEIKNEKKGQRKWEVGIMKIIHFFGIP